MGGIADFCKGTLAPRVASRLPSVLRFVASHRRDVAGGVIALAAVALILVNGLFMQSGPHPAPFFANPVSLPKAAEIRSDLQVVPAVPARSTTGSRTPQTVSTRRNDPIADLIGSSVGSSARVAAVQRALAEFGYGQIKPSGVLDLPTSAAIEKFEGEHKLPITGRLSDRLLSELASMTGRPIE